MPRVLSHQEIEGFREKLVDTATGLFAKKGREGFSMRELAQALGVSPMTPYRYFEDKEEILASVRAHAFDLFSEELENAYERRERGSNETESALAAAGAVARAYVHFALSNPASYRLMFDIGPQDGERYPELARSSERARATMTRHVEPLIAVGLIQGDPLLVGHMFWAVIHGAVMLKLSGSLGPEYGMQRIIDEAFRAMTVGLAPGR